MKQSLLNWTKWRTLTLLVRYRLRQFVQLCDFFIAGLEPVLAAVGNVAEFARLARYVTIGAILEYASR